jgi:site-specific DNA-methyltransferase (adenine-specific)
MQDIEDKSIDMILSDSPYGITACKWDSVIPFELLWDQYKRIIKDRGAIVLTASQPFTSALVMSNPKMFRCSWVWEKEQGVNFLMARKQPMKVHEDVLVFSNAQPIYKPVMTHGKPYISGKGTSGDVTGNVIKKQTANLGSRYPRTVIKIKRETGLHPTQKPVSLFEYLIKTYTNEGDTVLDNCAGSGTSGVACINTNRKYILIEKEEKYFEICKQRVNDAVESITKI